MVQVFQALFSGFAHSKYGKMRKAAVPSKAVSSGEPGHVSVSSWVLFQHCNAASASTLKPWACQSSELTSQHRESGLRDMYRRKGEGCDWDGSDLIEEKVLALRAFAQPYLAGKKTGLQCHLISFYLVNISECLE